MANRNLQKFGPDAVRRRLSGNVDPRGMTGILSRGSNIYQGASNAAQFGQRTGIGRPVGAGDMSPLQSAIKRRMASQTRTGVGNRRAIMRRRPSTGMMDGRGWNVSGNRRLMPYG